MKQRADIAIYPKSFYASYPITNCGFLGRGEEW